MSQITDEQVEAAVRGLHEALGGDGWAYTNYGGDELRSRRAELEAGVRAVAAAISTPPVGAETGEPVAWLHEPTGNVFKDGECQALIKAWQKQFADTMPPEEIAADFVPLVRTSPAVPNTVGEDKL